MKNSQKIIIMCVIAAIIITVGVLVEQNMTGKFLFSSSRVIAPSNTQGAIVSNSRPSSSRPLITYSNLALELSKNQLVKDLPSNAIILLRFYNFNTGERQWEKSYVLTTGNAREGLVDNADITIVIHSRYLSSFTSTNFCSVIKTAKANNDLGIWYTCSKMSLMWKFKSMMKYRECLGF